jgi:arginine-tRNA-protein transferase
MNTVKIYGSTDADCGYCKGRRAAIVDKTSDACSKAYTVVASNLEPRIYQDLVNRGWRRSGVAIYKPDNWNSCCPALTIRLPVKQFTPSKGQRKILKRMDNLLSGGVSTSGTITEKSKTSSASVPSTLIDFLQSSGVLSSLQHLSDSILSKLLLQRWPNVTSHGAFPPFKVLCKEKEGKGNQDKKGGNFSRVTLMSTVCAMIAGKSKGTVDRDALSEAFAVAMNEYCKGFPFFPLKEKLEGIDIASFKRHRVDAADAIAVHSLDRHASSGQLFFELSIPNFLITTQGDAKTCVVETQDADMKCPREDKVASWWRRVYPQKPLPVTRPLTLSVTSVRAHESALDPDVHRLYWKYQVKVHGDTDPFVDTNQQPSASSEWATRAPSGWRAKADSVLESEYSHLASERYERLRSAFRSFYEFLVENPFVNNIEDSGDTTVQQLGTIHQHYRLANGLLIAVGVVDVLPQGLSSVYLFYDPTFADEFVPLGKYSILKEIEWTRCSGLPYYYLGYYIESCQKMRYKAEYKPSQLLCPTTCEWVDADEAVSKLQRESPVKHCCTLADQPPGHEPDVDADASLTQIQMDIGQDNAITIGMLTPEGQDIVKPILLEFLLEASPRIATQCMIDLRP